MIFGIYFDILSGILRVQARVRVQAWSAASGAADVEFGFRRGPLHPKFRIWCSCPRTRKGGREEGEKGGAAPSLETLNWRVGISRQTTNMFQNHKRFKNTANTYRTNNQNVGLGWYSTILSAHYRQQFW